MPLASLFIGTTNHTILKLSAANVASHAYMEDFCLFLFEKRYFSRYLIFGFQGIFVDFWSILPLQAGLIVAVHPN